MGPQQTTSISFSMPLSDKLHGFDGFLFKFDIQTPAPTPAQAFRGTNPNPRIVTVDLIGLIDRPRQRCPLAKLFIELPADVDQHPYEATQLQGDFGFCGLRLYRWRYEWAWMAGIFALGVGFVDEHIADRNDGSLVEKAQRGYMVAATRAAFLQLIDWNTAVYDIVMLQVNNPRNVNGIFAPERILRRAFGGRVPRWFQSIKFETFDELREMVAEGDGLSNRFLVY